MLLLDVFYLLMLILLSPWLLLMLAIKPAFREGFAARFILRNSNVRLRESVWLHGSSAGEINLLRPLVTEIEQQSTARNIVISAFSISGFTAAKKVFPQHLVIYFPVDFSPVIRGFLKRLRPVLIVLVESEFWPNFIATVGKADVSVCVLNSRMSQKSFQVHKRTRLIPWVLKQISLFAVQTESDATRFRDLSVPESRIHVTGNMKYDLQDGRKPEEAQHERRERRQRYAVDEDMPVIIGGSIHRGEDLALARAYQRLL